MAETTISQLRVNGETRDIADSWARQQLDSSGDHGHKIMDESGVIYPNRRKLKFINADVSDDAENDTTIVDINVTRIVGKPTVTVEEYIYNGSEQGPTISGLTDDMVVRDAKKVNVGTYTMVISLKNKKIMTWSDLTTDDIIYTYNINKITVPIPSVEGNFTYDGTEKECTLINFDENNVAISGDVKATNANNYELIFDLKDKTNSIWSDESVSIKTGSWVINKGITTITSSINNIQLNTTSLYTDFSLSHTGSSGLMIVSSEDTNVASVSLVQGSVYRVTMSSSLEFNATTYINVTIPSDSNYESGFLAIPVSAKKIPELNQCSWATISDISSRGGASACWNIGDCKEITLNGNVGNYLTLNNIKYDVFILGFDHNSDLEGTGISFGCFKSLDKEYDFAIWDNHSKHSTGDLDFSLNHWEYYQSSGEHGALGGWAACDARYDILGSTDAAPNPYGTEKPDSAIGNDPSTTCATNPKTNTLLAAFPSDLRSVMKKIAKWSFNTGTSITRTYDYLPLMSTYEVLGEKVRTETYYTEYYEETTKQRQYQYYINGNSVDKYRPDTYYYGPDYYVLRTRHGRAHFNIIEPGGSVAYNGSYNSLSISPIFLV